MITFITAFLISLTISCITDYSFDRPFKWKQNIVAAIVIASFVWIILY